LKDAEAGRVMPLDEAVRRVRKRHGLWSPRRGRGSGGIEWLFSPCSYLSERRTL